MKPKLRHFGLLLGSAILLLWLSDRFGFRKGQSQSGAITESSPDSRTDPSGSSGSAKYPFGRKKPDSADGSAEPNQETIRSSLLTQLHADLRKSPDPAAEKLFEAFQEAGIPEAEQIRHFWHTYNQLTRIDYHDELIAEDRLATRTSLQEVATNSIYTDDARRQSRQASEELRANFEGHLRKQQAEMLDEVVRALGNTQFPADELKRRLLEIHPHLPLEGPVTNLLTPPPQIIPARAP